MLLLISLSKDWIREGYNSQEIAIHSGVGSENCLTSGSLAEGLDLIGSDYKVSSWCCHHYTPTLNIDTSLCFTQLRPSFVIIYNNILRERCFILLLHPVMMLL